MASTSTAAPVATTKVPNSSPNTTTTTTKARSASNGSMGSQGSETGRLLQSLGSVDGFADIGTGLEPSGAPVAAAVAPPPVKASTPISSEATPAKADSSKSFHVPASVVPPQNGEKKKAAEKGANNGRPMEDQKPAAAPAPPAVVRVSFPKGLKPSVEVSGTASKQQHSSRNLPERRMQPKKRKASLESYDTGLGDRTHSSSSFSLSAKRKMSHESYGSALMAESSKDSQNTSAASSHGFSRRKMSCESYGSAMGDISLGLESLDSGGIMPKQPLDGASVATKESGASDKSPPAPHMSLPTVGGSALDHLNALGDDGAEAGADAGLPSPARVVVAADGTAAGGLKKSQKEAQ